MCQQAFEVQADVCGEGGTSAFATWLDRGLAGWPFPREGNPRGIRHPGRGVDRETRPPASIPGRTVRPESCGRNRLVFRHSRKEGYSCAIVLFRRKECAGDDSGGRDERC